MRRFIRIQTGSICLSAVILLIGETCFAQTHVTYQNAQYTLRIQRAATTQRVYTNNSRVLDITSSAMFYIKKEDVAYIHQKLGPDYASKFVPEMVQSEISRIAGEFTDRDIISEKRDELQKEVLGTVGKKMARYRIQLRDVMFVSVAYSPEVEAAVIKKNRAEEQLAMAKVESETAAVRWQQQKEAAKVQTENNRIISEGLDSKILQLKYIQALQKLAQSGNSIVVVYGDGDIQLPVFESDSETASPAEKKKFKQLTRQKALKTPKTLKSPYSGEQ